MSCTAFSPRTVSVDKAPIARKLQKKIFVIATMRDVHVARQEVVIRAASGLRGLDSVFYACLAENNVDNAVIGCYILRIRCGEMARYIHELAAWPDFRWDHKKLA